MLIDTHAHVNFNAFKDDADEIIKKSLEGGVFMINVGSQYVTSKRAVEMAEKYGVYPHTKDISQEVLDRIKDSGFNISNFGVGVYAAVGLHPIHVLVHSSQSMVHGKDYEEFDYEKYLELAQNPKVVAIGEMGLDYFHLGDGDTVADRPLSTIETTSGRTATLMQETKDKQKEVFLEGIKLANEVGKPMIIHCREAYDDLLEILRNNPINKKGIIHCFVGSLKTAGNFIELGYKIGLNGIITYSPSYDKLIKNISLDDIVLETDCPYLTPKPLAKDERNEPVNVKYVAEKIAEVRQVDTNEIIKATSRNAGRIFTIY